MKPEADTQPPLEVDARAVAAIGVFVFLLPVLAMLAVGWYYHPPEAARAGQRTEPRLQTGSATTDPARADRERLDSYGWIDRQQGIVHVPIETAMAAEVAKAAPRTGHGK